MRVLDFIDIHRAYVPGQDVLAGVSFSVAAGEVVGLLGRNGAGKTTLIRIAMGMLEPQRGEVRVFGLDPRLHPVEVKRRIGYVAEDQTLPEFLRVAEVVQLHRELYPTWDEGTARRLAERFELPSHARIRELSRGQARQVALLCAVSHRPELLILDEPAGGLDPAARREFLETSIELLSDTGSAILFSSHHMTDVERMASRLVMIHDRQKWIDSTLDDLHEGYCLALIPHDPAVDGRRILSIDGCLCVWPRADAMHAVFEHEPATCSRLLEQELGIDGVRCRPLELEEMFIELVGGNE
jgi:ABC-2 type transport system ATP-binding protein